MEDYNKIAPVTKAKIPKEKSGFKKFSDAFLPRSDVSIGDFLIQDIIVPAIKRGITSIVDILLYGRPASGNYYNYTNNPITGSRVSYKDYKSMSTAASKYQQTMNQRSTRQSYNFEDAIIPTRQEASDALNRMQEVLDVWGKVRVTEWCNIISIPVDYTLHSYGWTEIGNPKIVPVGRNEEDGFRIVGLPKIKLLDD